MSTDARGSLPTGHWTSESDEETLLLGARIGEHLKGGEILLLDGPLGAGKTIFVKGIASALGVDEDDVTSPSFTLVNLYEGRLKLYHLDLYRLNEGAEAAHAVDLDELLTDERAVVVIEWGARLGRYPLPSPVFHVSLSGDGDAPRRIFINSLLDVDDDLA
ncbi:MAG: tRNA threonylcarbamoyladenosine biosynthesis protein TsaE [Blastocatellia bacterium]|jgi:tRNA threonylcarbamoyladenosine biosynthesis protein TsaE|nr:tRNA threonylcarbamoyladenosine biosynthesis protein TsaE [Blastocatellia bacterium]